jgi:hypothetical protein
MLVTCFRLKEGMRTRGPGGHAAPPKVGTPVRVYANLRNGTFHAVYAHWVDELPPPKK